MKSFFDLSIDEIKTICIEHKMPSFRATQIFEGIYAHQKSLGEISSLPLSLKEWISTSFDFTLPLIDSSLASQDGSEKFLLRGSDGAFFEMVIMPTEHRRTLCLSSQVGCKMGCTFCQTGKMGFKRNLSSGEMIGQLMLANLRLKERALMPISHIVFMGMGEPLDNLVELQKAIEIFCHEKAFGLHPSKITVSTSGLVPEIKKLSLFLPVKLAISFHNPFDKERSSFMPINRKYSLACLKEALLEYAKISPYPITFEYVMIEGQNDSMCHAKALVSFVHGLKAKVNLIPMNSHPGSLMQSSKESSIQAFQKYLSERYIPAPIRYSRGQDVSAACGQLAAKRESELLLDPRIVSRLRREEKSVPHAG